MANTTELEQLVVEVVAESTEPLKLCQLVVEVVADYTTSTATHLQKPQVWVTT
jgi:hypothetical protein